MGSDAVQRSFFSGLHLARSGDKGRGAATQAGWIERGKAKKQSIIARFSAAIRMEERQIERTRSGHRSCIFAVFVGHEQMRAGRMVRPSPTAGSHGFKTFDQVGALGSI